MRWGARSAEPGALGWVRPLHSIVATFGPETEEPDIVAFAVDGIAAGDETRGHRFMAPQPFKVRRFEDYAAKLEKAKVVLDPERRRQIILADAKNLAFAQGYELVEDEGLLGRGRRAGRMAGRADGLVRRSLPRDPERGDPRHHPQQPEMLRAARSEDREARAPNSSWSPTSRPRTAARRSSPATSASSARGCPMPSSSTRPI